MTTGCGVGDGWNKYTDDLTKRIGINSLTIYSSELPSAEALLPLARIKFEEKQWSTAAQAVPVYLR
jgi:hypothetical protein